MLVSAETVMANLTTHEHSCCKTKKEVPKEEKKNCCGQACNPFESCCSMMGFIPQSGTLSFKKAFISKEKFELHSENILSSFKGEAWNPPKI